MVWTFYLPCSVSTVLADFAVDRCLTTAPDSVTPGSLRAAVYHYQAFGSLLFPVAASVLPRDTLVSTFRTHHTLLRGVVIAAAVNVTAPRLFLNIRTWTFGTHTHTFPTADSLICCPARATLARLCRVLYYHALRWNEPTYRTLQID